MNFTDYRIVIAKDAGIAIKAAAKKLLSHFGATEIVTDDTPVQGKEILLGLVNRAKSLPSRPDIYFISVKDGDLVVDASHYTGVEAAVKVLCAADPANITVAYNYRGKTDIPLTWGEYKLVWNDEFDGDDLDTDKWVGRCNMAARDVVQTMDPGTVDVQDGRLVLTTHVLDRENPQASYLTNYSITTADTMNFRYGYMEIRAKVPHYAMGEWPSWWFLSAGASLAEEAYQKEHGPDSAPAYNIEIDAYEVFSDKTHIVPALHQWGKDFHRGIGFEKEAYHFSAVEDANDWHTYGFLWTEKEVAFSVDGHFYCRYDLSLDFGKTYGMEDFHQSVYMLFNNFVFTPAQKNWSPIMHATNDDLFPLIYQIDYCRLYQPENDPTSRLYQVAESGIGYRLSKQSGDWFTHGDVRSASWQDYVKEETK